MKTPIFTGSGTAVVTPFRDGQVNHEKMAQLIDLQAAGGTAALIVCGTTGEAATLSPGERNALIEYTVRYTDGRMKVIAGVGSNDTAAALQGARAAEAAGADGILMVTPYYNKTNPDGLIRHFLTVADAVELPMVVYNVPSRTGIGCTLETYKALAVHPNVNGVKEASGDFTLAARTLAVCGDTLTLWSGNDDHTVPMMALGAKGVISVAANLVPAVMTRLCALCLRGNFSGAAALYRRYAGLMAGLFMEVNPIPVRQAMELLGYDIGPARQPLWPMAPDNVQKLRGILADCGLREI